MIPLSRSPIEQKAALFLTDGGVLGRGAGQGTGRRMVEDLVVLKLVEDHLIGLGRPVSNVVPDFNAIMHPPGPITVRDVLAQTSGIPGDIPVTLPNVDIRPQDSPCSGQPR